MLKTFFSFTVSYFNYTILDLAAVSVNISVRINAKNPKRIFLAICIMRCYNLSEKTRNIRRGAKHMLTQQALDFLVENQLNGVHPAVVIIILASGALAFVVLFNLSDINITERRRELATLRVLGFRDKEMRQYVFRENVILTLFGIALGLVFGYYFHAFVMSTVEVDLVMFGREPHYIGYVLSAVITMFFAAVVNAIAGKNLNKIDMIESMKSVE